MNDEFYYVEECKETRGTKYTFKEACELAYQESFDYSAYRMVRHEFGYVPARIYFCGHIYEQPQEATR